MINNLHQHGFIYSVSKAYGIHETALRLVISLLFAYPLAFLYNKLLTKQYKTVKNLYFFISGISLGYFIFGFKILHSLATVILVYVNFKLFKADKRLVAINFSIAFSYLLGAYYIIQTDKYTFEWTIPQCVLTLRLIAITYDIYDGQRIKNQKVTKEVISQEIIQNSALLQVPSFLEILSISFFPSSFLVGPQFEARRFLKFVSNEQSSLNVTLLPGLKKLAESIFYIAVFQFGSSLFPISYLSSDAFNSSNLFVKHILIGLTTRFQCLKYVGIWFLAEGSLIISGFTYNHETKQLDNYSNIDTKKFLTTSTFDGIIKSFNITTNVWSKNYIFKRLRFFGSRFISHFLTLTFLALWHGWQSGYYVTFSMEFLIMKMEWDVKGLINEARSKSKKLDNFLNHYWLNINLLLKFYTMVMFGYCLVPFFIFTYKGWLPVYTQLCFSGHIIYVSWFFISPLINYLMKYSKSKNKAN